jgi:8-oxo-dGTP diphosphatase
MIKNYHIGIKAVIFNNKKALILTEADIDGGKTEIYNLPGGRMEDGETIEETLGRELKEELGITNFTLRSLISACVHPHYEVEGSKLMLLFFKVYINDFEIKLSKEYSDYQWISRQDLRELVKNKEKIHKGIIEALQIALR